MYRIGLLCSPLHPRCLEYCKYVPQTLTDVIITSVDVCRIYLLTHAIYLHLMVHVDVISYPRNGPQTANVIWHWHYQAGNLLPHYGDVIMSAMASQITSLTVVCSNANETPKLRVTGLCTGNSPVTGEFPAKRACNEENVSIWWRHHSPWVGSLTTFVVSIPQICRWVSARKM